MNRAGSPNDDVVDKIGPAQDRNDVPDSYRLWPHPTTPFPYPGMWGVDETKGLNPMET